MTSIIYVSIAIAATFLFTVLLLGHYPDSVYLYYLTAVSGFLFLIHSLFCISKYLQIYIIPIYAVLLLTAPIVAIKILYPYFISPRRFYAHFLRLDKDPWNPPGHLSSSMLSHLCLFVYLYTVTYFTFKLMCLRKCGIAKEDVLQKYSIRMTTLSYCIFLVSYLNKSIASMVDLAVSWMPFKDDMISAAPMCLLSTLVLLIRYEPLIIQDTCPQPTSNKPTTASGLLTAFLDRFV